MATPRLRLLGLPLVRRWPISRPRWITHLLGTCLYTLVVRCCLNRACTQCHVFVRPAAEGALELLHDKFGLDGIALVGQ
jgi:hypothetical protein